MRSTAALVLDAVIVVLLLTVLIVIVTGGGVYYAAGIRISTRSTSNPMLIAVLLLAARLAFSSRAPFSSRTNTPSGGFWRWAAGPLQRLEASRLPRHAATLNRGIVGLCVGVTLVKLTLAWAHPGFFSGDDVEIHEMSLGILLGQDWPAWELRSPFYPLGVIYPVQWAAHSLGLRDTAALIFIGRAVVCLLSAFTILLTWAVGRRLWRNAPGYAFLATLLVALNSIQVAFGSTELPRPLATTLVVLAFSMLSRGGNLCPGVAGAVVGIASAFRYSEVTFLAAGFFQLVSERRWKAAAAYGIGGAAAAAIALGTADALYWGSPFYSLQQAIDYTLVDRLSSRGYQSADWYATHAGEWSSWPVVALALIGTFRAPRSLGLWAWLPILMLSLLPHKEARYILPSIPFVCLLAAFGVQAVLEARRPSFVRPPERLRAIIVVALVFAILQEAGEWRLRRTDADIALFHSTVLPNLGRDDSLAAEQAWRIGGRLYQPPGVRLIDLDGTTLTAGPLPSAAWILLDETTLNRLALEEKLSSSGYVEMNHLEDSSYRVFRRP